MDTSVLLILLVVTVLIGGGFFVFALKGGSSRGKRAGALRQYRSYLNDNESDLEPGVDGAGDDGGEGDSAEQVEEQIEATKKKRKKKSEPTIEEKLFMAGKLTAAQRNDFYRKKKLAPIVFGLVGTVLGVAYGTSSGALFGIIFGLGLGYYLPMVTLRKWIEAQHEDLAYNLPLLIEQISIGVSSSLDIGPCLSQIVQMSDERKSHNAATQMIKYALFYVKSGVSLEEALIDIGKSSGQPEFKHALLALSQVAKFGGEISKQLQDLADTVSAQQESKVEAQLKKIELKAGGPVMVVFLAYMVMLGLSVAGQFMTGMK